jgi:hypothetical protein
VAEDVRRRLLGVEYPMKAAQVRMLEIVQERLDHAHEQGKLQVRLTVDQVAAFGDELGIPEASAVALFARLGNEGYFAATGLDKPVFSGSERYPFFIVHVDGLTTSGLLEIGPLPDPAERLLHSLDALAAAIDERHDLEPQQKQLAKRAAAELKTFVRGVPPGVAVEVGSAFFRGIWGG